MHDILAVIIAGFSTIGATLLFLVATMFLGATVDSQSAVGSTMVAYLSTPLLFTFLIGLYAIPALVVATWFRKAGMIRFLAILTASIILAYLIQHLFDPEDHALPLVLPWIALGLLIGILWWLVLRRRTPLDD